MHSRYENKQIKNLWSDESKLSGWEAVELAVIKARANLKRIPEEIYVEIRDLLKANPIDIDWWKKCDSELQHDLNAFVMERVRFLPTRLHQFFHDGLTSYDTEESPFVRNLENSLMVLCNQYEKIQDLFEKLARKHRFTVMMGKTHGQDAELQSFGKRVLTWLVSCDAAYDQIMQASKVLEYSKLSGAIGNYGGLDPELETEALNILGLKPYYGATQIMPRVIYAPIAQGICNLVMTLDNVALNIRLAARTGLPLLREPFGKKQTGSTKMPQKQNTIKTEQTEGQMRLVKAYMLALTENIITWEERAIEQSCVERVAWPDIFHAASQVMTVMEKILSGLRVYPDNMIQEILNSRGTYAAGEVKEFLKKHLSKTDLSYEDIYRLVQLACFNVFEVSPERLAVRDVLANSYEEAANNITSIKNLPRENNVSIKDHISRAELRVNDQLEISEEQVKIYNRHLDNLFRLKNGASNFDVYLEWNEIFSPAHLLKNEEKLFTNIIGL
jgi:adenylosuccinate lyase